MAALISNLETASTDEEVRAVLLCGDGEDFCSGFDIVGRNAQRDVRPRTGSIQRRSSRSPDFREGMKAFTERRPPEFTGQ